MSPTFTVAGLLPFRVMTGASVSGVVVEVVVDVVELPPMSPEVAAPAPPPPEAPAAEARSASSWVRVTQVSPAPSETQALWCALDSQRSPLPHLPHPRTTVSRAKRLEKKADTNGSFPTAGVDVAKSSSLRVERLNTREREGRELVEVNALAADRENLGRDQLDILGDEAEPQRVALVFGGVAVGRDLQRLKLRKSRRRFIRREVGNAGLGVAGGNVDESRGGDVAQNMELVSGRRRSNSHIPRDIDGQNRRCRGIADEHRPRV